MPQDIQEAEEGTQSLDPAVLPVLPLRDMVVFPNSITPLFVVRPKSIAALEDALSRDKTLLCVLQKEEMENPTAKDLVTIGTVCEILQILRVPDGSAKVLIEGNYVARVVEYQQGERFTTALAVREKIEPVQGLRARALMRIAFSRFEAYARLSEKIPDDLLASVRKIEEPNALLNAIAHYAGMKTPEKQTILEASSVEEKYRLLLDAMQTENQMLELEQKIIAQVKGDIGKSQRDYFLNEQKRAIERELGIHPDEESEYEEFKKAIDASGMPKEAAEKAEKELRRLGRMAPVSPEATVSRTWLEWLTEIPWKKETKDKIDLKRAQSILDADHYGLEKIKERIVEHLAVASRTGLTQGPILCFVGPPGVGKTSLARSIARCIGRNFIRVSLGGVRDEAEIRGHRRTYIGALPGKVVQQMRKCGSVNPVFLLDEIDKMSSDFRGDPASALLEVLDPEQNKAFNDHYLEVDYDLSKVLFIATANSMEGIPLPLLDRMEVIRLAGYTEIEKRKIATKYLIPRQMAAAGLAKNEARFTQEALEMLVRNYTKEAGVRNLEREIGAVCRKLTKRHVENKSTGAVTVVDGKTLRSMLGPLRYSDPAMERRPETGVALGLAWTQVGGELLPVETIMMPGKGGLQLTGKLGDVMQESGKAALTWIRAHCTEFDIAADLFKDVDIHVHVPEGATPKDGPSAGVTMATSMISALSGRAVRQDVAMTGEVTLRGKVLRIGGLKEKALAAHRFGIRQVLIPAENLDDLEEVPAEVRKVLTFIPVESLDEVLAHALVPKKVPAARGKATAKPSAKKPDARGDWRRPTAL